MIAICLCLYGQIVAYGTVFGSSASANIAIPFLNGGDVCDFSSTAVATDGCVPLYRFYVGAQLRAVP
jgi:hypothetical protein